MATEIPVEDVNLPLEGPARIQQSQHWPDLAPSIMPESLCHTPVHRQKHSQTVDDYQTDDMPRFNRNVQLPASPSSQHSHQFCSPLVHQQLQPPQTLPSRFKDCQSVGYRQSHHPAPTSNPGSIIRTETRPDTKTISVPLSSGGGNGSGIAINSSSDDFYYILRIRQQPAAARSCGYGDKDRRMIDPPPIIQLSLQGPNLTEEEIAKHLRYPHYVMNCSIYDETGSRDTLLLLEGERQQRRLIGCQISTSFVGEDERGEEGCFFSFPDLSCRTTGLFRLGFSLVKLDTTRAKEVKHLPILAMAQSNTFAVYAPLKFPGMQGSTELAKRLRKQGCMIPMKRANDRVEKLGGQYILDHAQMTESSRR